MVRISVLMGIYNCEQTLREALDSLLAQTCQDFKVIMCDDGSKDGTMEIASSYVRRYPEKFLLIQNEKNMGLNFTLNHCLEYADTEYCARMDGDDVSLPHRFQEEIDFLDAHKEYAIVSGPMIYFDEQGEFRRGKGRGMVSPIDFIHGSPFCHAPCMVRTEAYKAVGGYTVDKKLLRVEDYHLGFKMYKAGFRGYMLKEPVYAMRDDRNATSRRTYSKRINVSRVMSWGFRQLKLPVWTQIYALRPLIVGLLPMSIYTYLHKHH